MLKIYTESLKISSESARSILFAYINTLEFEKGNNKILMSLTNALKKIS